MPKKLLERLENDVKRHRAPQIEALPDWAKAGFETPKIAVKSDEKPRKSEKKKKKKK